MSTALALTVWLVGVASAAAATAPQAVETHRSIHHRLVKSSMQRPVADVERVRGSLQRRGYYGIDFDYRRATHRSARACRAGHHFALSIDRAGGVASSRYVGSCRHQGVGRVVEHVEIGRSQGGRFIRIEGPYHSIAIRLF
jgi:hypothetical protein